MAGKSPVALRLVHGVRFSLLRLSTSEPDDASRKIRLTAQSGDAGHENVSKWDAKRIAIVDDDEDLCKIYSVFIKSLGYRVEFVSHNGNGIVQAVSEGSIEPDLIIMDYRMPMNGMQAAERVLRVRPDIKIVLVSADDSVKREADSAGILFVQKPFTIQLLTKALHDALR